MGGKSYNFIKGWFKRKCGSIRRVAAGESGHIWGDACTVCIKSCYFISTC